MENRKKDKRKFWESKNPNMPVPIFSSGYDMGALLRVPLYFGRKDETQPHIYLARPCSCFVNAIRFPPSPAMMWKHKSLWPGWRMCWYESFPWKNRCSLAKQIRQKEEKIYKVTRRNHGRGSLPVLYLYVRFMISYLFMLFLFCFVLFFIHFFFILWTYF